MAIDLHLHSTASDGNYSPEQIIERAHELGLTTISLTDHDTIAGIKPAMIKGKQLGVEVIPGLELNTDYNGQEIHILGYYFDLSNPGLLTCLDKLKRAREYRVEGIVKKLRSIGIDISLPEVYEESGGGCIGRPHIARILLRKGYISYIKQAFEKYIGVDGPAYVGRYKVSPAEAVSLIRQAKGIPVLAHPGVYKDDFLIPQLIEVGLLGVEVYHSDHDQEKRDHYLSIAQRHGLIVTGGSDCHGPNNRGRHLMGQVAVPEEIADSLRALRNQIWQGG